jgi:lipopolysaccharide/colanic/teichoic acid biosynthesis glycosyltransferase
VLIVLFLPVCVAVAVAIKLDSPGPVFADVPERVGQGERNSRCTNSVP